MAYWKNKKTTIRPAQVITKVPRSSLSPYQAVCVDFAVNGTGNGVVEAVAGSGKTETCAHMIQAYSEAFPGARVLYVVFNNSVKANAEARFPASIDVLTCHGLGYGVGSKRANQRGVNKGVVGAWGKRYRQLKAVEPQDKAIQNLLQSQIPEPERGFGADLNGVCQLLSLAKTRLVSSPAAIGDLVDKFGIELNRIEKEQAVSAVEYALEHTRRQPLNGGRVSLISFDDMVWLPVVDDQPMPEYDLVIIDEAQDLSAARTALILKCVAPRGRVIAVGDRYQAIYGFAGADVDALPDLIEALSATVLPLSVTYRCPKAVVELAKTYNPNIEAAPDAIEGHIGDSTVNEMFEKIQAGDCVISRTNAPLVSLFFALNKQGKKAVMLGRDFGKRLSTRIWWWKKEAAEQGLGFNGLDLLARNDAWAAQRLQHARSDQQKIAISDEAGMLEELVRGVDAMLTSEDCVSAVEKVLSKFRDSDDNLSDAVVLSSTHKFKGDERANVWQLIDTYGMGEKEETNLCYVAVTRVLESLNRVEIKPWLKSRASSMAA